MLNILCFAYLLEACIEILQNFLRFGQNITIENLKRNLILALFILNIVFWLHIAKKKVDKKKWKSRGWSHMQEMKGVRQMLEDLTTSINKSPPLFFWICPCVYTFHTTFSISAICVLFMDFTTMCACQNLCTIYGEL